MKIHENLQKEYDEYVVKNSKDSYSKGVVDYTAKWGDVMEAAIAEGKAIADIADSTSHEADTDGITGFMYGCAVSALARFWVHGEELWQWHNLDTQIADEGEKANKSGGTLNPALLNVHVD